MPTHHKQMNSFKNVLNKHLLWIALRLFWNSHHRAVVHNSFFFLWHLLSGDVCLSVHLFLFEACLPSFIGDLPSLVPSSSYLASGYPRVMSLPCPYILPYLLCFFSGYWSKFLLLMHSVFHHNLSMICTVNIASKCTLNPISWKAAISQNEIKQ